MITLVFDWETTGLTLHPDAPPEKQPRAIEFGGLLIDGDGQELEAVDIMINPGDLPLPPEIVKITGITDADLQDAPPFAQVLPQIARMFSQAQLCIAHNLPFDRSILRLELARAGVTDFPWPQHELCTVGLYRDHWGRNPRLVELYEAVMGRPLAQTHRALDDVRALAEIVVKERLWTMFEND